MKNKSSEFSEKKHLLLNNLKIIYTLVAEEFEEIL